jgi:hypothetical protein
MCEDLLDMTWCVIICYKNKKNDKDNYELDTFKSRMIKMGFFSL